MHGGVATEKGVNLYHRLTPIQSPEFELQGEQRRIGNRISELEKE
jgi:hypothetical protein